MLQCNLARKPAETTHKFDVVGPPAAYPSSYYSLVGALQYLTFMHPDIAFPIQQICHFMHDPHEPHLHALKHILRYIRGTLDHGLQIYVTHVFDLRAYYDAD